MIQEVRRLGRPLIDLTGQKFGMLTVVSLAEDGHRKDGSIFKRWNCICDCGNSIVKAGASLITAAKKQNYIPSCGCHKFAASINGEQFGDLTVLEEVRENGNLSYKCKCVCGNEIIVSRTQLIKGLTTHCGCKKEQVRHPERIKDLTGQRFNHFTVLKLDDEVHRSKCGAVQIKWICQCDCGNIVSVNRQSLVDGRKKSCGCVGAAKRGVSLEEYRASFENKDKSNLGVFKDLTGQRFGKLVALHVDTSDSGAQKRATRWICQCDCGNTASVITSNLTNGHTRSCGCITSVGETAIMYYLTDHNITFKQQLTFPDCRDSHPLPFDFGIYKDNALVGIVEYDGLQHFEPVRFNGMTEERSRESYYTGLLHDEMKNAYCKEKSISLLRIKYTELDNIQSILDNYLRELGFGNESKKVGRNVA